VSSPEYTGITTLTFKVDESVVLGFASEITFAFYLKDEENWHSLPSSAPFLKITFGFE
jgi:hypothetical protein